MNAIASERRIAGLRIRRIESTLGPQIGGEWHPKDDLPDLMPPEARLSELRSQMRVTERAMSQRIRLTSRSAMQDNLNPVERPEHGDPVARMTVYVMNLIVVVMAQPIGLALLMFNIMFGENIRTTAHAMALTGMAIALAGTSYAPAQALLSFL